MTKSVTTKSGPESKDTPDEKEHVTVDNREVWLPKECPKCQRLLKTRKGYDKHTKACTKEPSKPRVILSDEERILRRKEGIARWVAKNTTIQIRILKGSEDMAYIDARVAELQELNPKAGWATYFIGLLEADKKRHAKRAAKASKKK